MDKCPKCGNEIKTRFGKKRFLKYFKCVKCGQKLAFARIGQKVKLYIDDVKHMRFMTSGVGGY